MGTKIQDYIDKLNTITIKEDGNQLHFFIVDTKIGYITYQYTGRNISEQIPDTEKEFVIFMIEVFESYQGRRLSDIILTTVKKYALDKGATIVTLKINTIIPKSNSYLQKIFLKNKFKYSITPDCEKDNSLMCFKL